MRQLNGVMPRLHPAQRKTYAILAPQDTHFRPATCAEINCEAYMKGWQLHKEILSPELLHTVETSGRSYREVHVREGETWMVFAPGQPCFAAAAHRLRLDKPELFVVRGGDFRGNPLNVRTTVHSGADPWVDDFATHQDKLADEGKKG